MINHDSNVEMRWASFGIGFVINHDSNADMGVGPLSVVVS